MYLIKTLTPTLTPLLDVCISECILQSNITPPAPSCCHLTGVGEMLGWRAAAVVRKARRRLRPGGTSVTFVT